MNRVLSLVFSLAILLLSAVATDAQTCSLSGLEPSATDEPCTSPSLRSVYGNRKCTTVPIDRAITWEPATASLVVQCYQGGLLVGQFGTQSGITSGSITFKQCSNSATGDAEIKLWTPRASSPCSAAPVKLIDCARARLNQIASPTFDSTITWTPAECLLTLQGYERGQLVGQFNRASSGSVRLAQLSTRRQSAIQIKGWAGGSEPVDTRSFETNDCRGAALTVPTIVDVEAIITWAIDSCVGTIQAYRGGTLVGERRDVASAATRVRDLGADAGWVELKLFPKGASQPSSSRYVEVRASRDGLASSSFFDDFERDQGWLVGVTEEVVNSFYSTGVGTADLSPDVSRSGRSSLRMISNGLATLDSNHLSAGNRLFDVGQNGPVSFRTRVYLPSMSADSGQTGPELSVQNTRQNGSQTATSIGAIQFKSNPLESPAERDGWAIWSSNSPTESPRWITVSNSELKRDRWYTIQLDLDYDIDEYVRLSVTGDDQQWTVSLVGRKIRAESRGFAPAFVLTLEAENMFTNSRQAKRNVVYYDDVEVFTLDPATARRQ